MWLNYRFDEWVSRGFWRMFSLLSLLLVGGACLVATARLMSADEQVVNEDFAESLWQTLFNSLDAGVIADDSNRPFRPVMLVATLMGLLILSTLIGVITNKIDARVAGVRRGRTPVCESDHVLILGWNDSIFDLLREIHQSADRERAPRVVLLANRENGEMMDALVRFVEGERAAMLRKGLCPPRDLRPPITRSGVPWDRAALAGVHPQLARWILVLTSPNDSDAAAIKTLLALDGLLPHERRPAVVTSVAAHENVALAKEAAGSATEVVNSDRMIARLLVQAARNHGIGTVIAHLTSFDGEELYSCSVPTELVGMSVRDAITRSRRHSLIGVERAGCQPQLLGARDVTLDQPLAAADRLWVLAENASDALQFAAMAQSEVTSRLQTADILPWFGSTPEPSRVLIVGWNRRGRLVLDELDEHLAAGSSVVVFDPTSESLDRDLERVSQRTRRRISKVQPIAVDDDMALWIERFHREFESLAAFDIAIVLDDTDTLADGVGTDLAVARVILELRKLRRETTGHWPRVVCEVADERTRELIRRETGEEFIASGRFVSSLMTHYALDPRRVPLYENIFDAPSAELAIRPVAELVDVSRPLYWSTVLEACLRRNEIAIGLLDDEHGRFGEVQLSVDRTRPLQLRGTAQIVVLAEHP
ncbi:MAG: hypothetical protein QM516_10560 [Limnohabitans sp.]|jgi:hypothetical protein|nr:hypothetical protein [Limnohabitans sp.]